MFYKFINFFGGTNCVPLPNILPDANCVCGLKLPAVAIGAFPIAIPAVSVPPPVGPAKPPNLLVAYP